MKKNWIVISTGFALFSMFFGSGNLVFPITVGQQSGGYFLLAALGILLTGVLVPFLGVMGMMLYEGDIHQFFRFMGKKGILIFSFCSLALMGPFGVLARCLTVIHGALLLLLPNISLYQTSFVVCVIIFFLAANKNRIVTVLGTILTPFLLVSIALIATFGLNHGVPAISNDLSSFAALKNGFFQGYQTMDLLAAFFFSQFVIKYLRDRFTAENNQGSFLKVFCQSSVIGALILSSIYLVLVMLGWIYSSELVNVPPQEMLGMIAMKSLGQYAAPCVCIAVMFACLTTAIVLASLFGEFLRNEMFAKKMGHKTSLIITLFIGFLVSTLEFSGIAKFLGPILEFIYPALILLTLINIVYKSMKSRQTLLTGSK